MIKELILLHRKPSMNTKEFWDYWEKTLQPLITNTPGVGNCHVEKLDKPDGSIIGMAELCFESTEARNFAQKSPEYQAVMNKIKDKPNLSNVDSHNTTETLKTYINILQGKTGRFIEGITNAKTKAEGLYTDEVTTCIPIVITGKIKGRPAMSMTHYDYSNAAADIIKRECSKFDEDEGEKSIYVYLKPEYSHPTDPSSMYCNVMQEDLHNQNIQYQERHLPEDQNAIIAYYDTEQNKFVISGLSTATMKDYPISLKNHPQAQTTYAYYKINLIAFEIEGYFNFLEKQSSGEAILLENNKNQYQGKIQHDKLTCKALATHVDVTRLIFDGEKFTTLKKHDNSLTPFATQLLGPVMSTTYNNFFILWNSLTSSLVKSEEALTKVPKNHQIKNWDESYSTIALALNISFLRLKPFDKLAKIAPDYYNTQRRYDNRYQERQGKIQVAKKLQEYNATLYETNGFFSPSPGATEDKPYGPYAEHLCRLDDPATQQAMALPKLVKR